MRPMFCAAGWPLRDAAIDREVDRAGEAVDQRGAVEQHAGRQRAQHEILEARLARAHVVALDGGDDVERQALQLEAEVERDQVAGRDHQQHAERRQQQQHRDIRASAAWRGARSSNDMSSTSAAPASTSSFMKRLKPSAMKAPSNSTVALAPPTDDEHGGDEQDDDREPAGDAVGARRRPCGTRRASGAPSRRREDDLGQGRRVGGQLLHAAGSST